MKLTNTGKFVLSFSIPKGSYPDGKPFFSLLVLNPGESIGVKPEDWEQISDRPSIKALEDNKNLLVSEGGKVGVKVAETKKAADDLEKAREKEIEDFGHLNYKRAINLVKTSDDLELLKAFLEGERRTSVEKALKSRIDELELEALKE